MAGKRAGHCDDAGTVRKKKKAYCHFKSAWKSQEFTVTLGGAEKTVSGKILSGVEGADNAKCTLPILALGKVKRLQNLPERKGMSSSCKCNGQKHYLYNL